MRQLHELSGPATGPEQGDLFRDAEPPEEREQPELAPTCVREETLLDYRITGVASGAHPVSFLRDELRGRGALRACDLVTAPLKQQVLSAGLVICRQRPGSAKGTTFLTLEDETGFVNVVVRSELYQRQRQLIRAAVLLQVRGRLERSGPVVNVVAESFEDLPFPVPGFASASRDFH